MSESTNVWPRMQATVVLTTVHARCLLCCSVFVSNLAYTVTAQQVKQFFEDNVGGVSGVSLFYRNDMPTVHKCAGKT